MTEALNCKRGIPDLSLEPLLTIDDLERLLQVNRRTVSRLCKDGKLPRPFKLGGGNRWRTKDIVDVLDSAANEACQVA